MPGFDSYFIIGEQASGWDTPVVTASMKQKIYEFREFALQNRTDPIIPTRFRRTASPTPQIENFLRAEGDVVMDLHADDLLWVLIHSLMEASVSSVDFTAQEVFGDGLGAGKAIPASPFSLDTQPTATTPASDPGILSLELDVSDSGVVTITGTDQNDAAITEVVTFSAEAGPKLTTKYFKTVNASGIAYTGLTVASTLYIECDMNVYTHTIAIGDALLDGLTIEAVKNGLPSVYIGALINQMTIDIGDVLGMTISMLAKRGWNRYKVPASGSVPEASTTPTDVSGYDPVSDEVFPAWSMSLQLDAVEVPIASGSFTFNNNLGFNTRYRNLRTMPKPTRQSPREIGLTCGIDYDTVNDDYDLAMLTSQTVAGDLYCYRKPFAGAEYMLHISIPRCELTQFPDPSVTEFPQVIQELNLRGIRTAGATTSDECEIVLQCVASD